MHPAYAPHRHGRQAAWQLYSAETAHVGVPWAFKNGGTAGSSTDTVIAPSERTGVTTMFNKERMDSDQIAVPILRLLIQDSRRILPATGSSAPGVVVVLGAAARRPGSCPSPTTELSPSPPATESRMARAAEALAG